MKSLVYCGYLAIWIFLIKANVGSDFLDPCSFWENSYYANAKCLKLIEPNSPEVKYNLTVAWWSQVTGKKGRRGIQIVAQTECQDQFPEGQLATIESVEELAVFRTMTNVDASFNVRTDIDASLPVKFKMAADNSLRIECGLNCINEYDYCVTCEDFYEENEAVACATTCPFQSSVTYYALCQQEVYNPCDTYLPGAIYQEGHCFKVGSEALSWTNAKAVCEKDGAFLAEAKTKEVIHWIHRVNKISGFQSLWTGASNHTPDHDYRWCASDVSLYDHSANYWNYFIELNTKLDDPNADYAIASTNETDWVALSIEEEAPYLCQKDIGNPCEIAMSGELFSSGYCLQHYTGNWTWNQATLFCQRAGGILLEPRTEEIRESVQNFMPNAIGSWIAAEKVKNDSQFWFRWEFHRSRVPIDGVNTTFNDSLDFLALSRDTSGTWEALTMDDNRDVVCQTDVSNPSRKYIVPLKDSFTESPLYVIKMSTALRSVRVYIILTAYLNGKANHTEHKSLTEEKALELELSELFPYGQLLEVVTSYPVTMELVVSLNGVMSTSLISPIQPFPGFSQRKNILLSLDAEEKSEVLVIPTQTSSTNIELTFESTVEKEVDIHGMKTSVGSGQFHKSLNLYQNLHLFGNPEDDEVILEASRDVAIFMDLDMSSSGTGPRSISLIQLSPSPATSKYFLALPCFPPFCSASCPLSPDNELWLMNSQSKTLQHCFASNTSNTTLLTDRHLGKVPMSQGVASQVLITSTPVHAWQIFKSCDNNLETSSMCTLVPPWLWRHQYTFTLPSETDLGEIHLVVHLRTESEDKIQLSNWPSQFTCAAISATQFSSCRADLTNHYESTFQNGLNVHQLSLNVERNERFGAYLLSSTKINRHSCHPLGNSDIMMKSSNWGQNDDVLDVGTCDWIDKNEEEEEEEEPPDPLPTTAGPVCPNPTTIPSPVPLPCSCENVTVTPIPTMVLPTEKEKQDIIKKIKKTLHVDAKATSKHHRKLTSAEDTRPSSTSIGILGIGLITFTVSGIILPDLVSLLRHLYKFYLSKRPSKESLS